MVDITEQAQAYFVELLSKQDADDIGIRIFISDPGTPMAETCIAVSYTHLTLPTICSV